MNIDLDAARAARLEKSEPKAFVLGGERFDLPMELPLKVGTLWGTGDVDAGFRLLLGEEAFVRFEVLPLSAQDLSELLDGLGKMYGFASGESEASVSSLPASSSRSRRTSRATTG